MPLHLTVGPMKSGKSLELIKIFSPLVHSDMKWVVLQPNLHGREDRVSSRAGASIQTTKVDGIDVDWLAGYDAVGIDEAHMFSQDDLRSLDALLSKGVTVYAVGLDMDYRGILTKGTVALMELGPTSVQCLVAVCDVCRSYEARFSQVLKNGEVVTGGLPSILPEDGTYSYEARCRTCFVRA
jgi:thymidine kinase